MYEIVFFCFRLFVLTVTNFLQKFLWQTDGVTNYKKIIWPFSTVETVKTKCKWEKSIKTKKIVHNKTTKPL